MNENQKILAAVKVWMIQHDYNHLGEGIWGNEYTEFYCNENDFDVLVLKKFNIEIHCAIIWQVPIQSVKEFNELIGILEKEVF